MIERRGGIMRGRDRDADLVKASVTARAFERAVHRRAANAVPRCDGVM